MKKEKSKKAKIATNIGIALLSIAFLYFLLRGPYLSNFTKRLIIPTLENATQEMIIMDSAVINLFPFYVQGKSVKVLDNDGNRILWITKTRAYIDLLGLLSGEIRIRKLWLKEPELGISRKELEKVVQNVKSYMSKGGDGKFRVTLKNVELADGKLFLDDVDGKRSFDGEELFFSMTSKKTIIANLDFKKVKLKLPGLNEITGGFKGKIRKGKDKIEISNVFVHSSGTSLEAKGEVLLDPEGMIKDGILEGKVEIEVLWLNYLFGLKEERDGQISFDGSIELGPKADSKWPVFLLDLKAEGHFYLETLMEILNVRHNIRGELSVNGKIGGTFPDIIGLGKARLEKAEFGRLPLDDVEGNISYRNKKFALNNSIAHTYDGRFEGSAHILIPHGDYSVTADVFDINSKEFFKYIKWNAPFPDGKISGDLKLDRKHGQRIEISANLDYLNSLGPDGNLLNRIESIHTSLEFSNNFLRLENTVLSAARSDLYLNGDLDLNKKTMELALRLESEDIADLTAPYYTKFIAPARFSGKASGPINDPELTGDLEVDSGTIHGIAFTKAAAGLKYKISSLDFDRLKIEHEGAKYNASGLIEFRKAKSLFSFEGPYYTANASLENVGMKPFITAAYRDIPVSGLVSGPISFQGDADDFRGSGVLIVRESDVYGQKIEKAEIEATLYPDKIEFQSVEVKVDDSSFNAKGELFFNKKFNVTITSGFLDTCDISIIHDHPISASINLNISGSGTIDDPKLEFSANILESYWKETRMGIGRIHGFLENKKLTANGSFLDGKITADARAFLSDKTKWNADIDIKKGRYDFLFSSLFKEVPEDLTVSLKGNVKLKAEGDMLSMQSKFVLAEIGLYEYDFINDEDIDLELRNDKLILKSFSLKGENVDFTASGEIELGKKYAVKMKGTMDIAPLKSLAPKLELLKGRSTFDLDIQGPWEKPEFLGEIRLENAVASLLDFQYKFGPVNGSFFINKNKITFESVNADFAGGRLVLSGIGYLEEFKLDKLYVSSKLSDIKIRPLEKVNAAFDGRLFYETSSKGSILTGNLDIKKARYGKKVVFNKFLLGLKEIKKREVDYAEFLGKTELNIHITGMDNILIDNNIARTPVKIALNVMGTIDQKGLLGRIEADEGEIFFRSNEFKVLEGSSVEFFDPKSITPLFHILAETYINDYYIKLSLDGTMDRFVLSLFSDPPLPETEILTLLTFGQVKRETRGFESGLAASEAASILTGDLQEAVEDSFKSITGFERFKIEPHTTTTGAFGSKLTVGKRVMEDKLFVIYSTSIGTTEEHFLKLKYKLHKKFSVEGTRDETGDTGVDFKYRFEFK